MTLVYDNMLYKKNFTNIFSICRSKNAVMRKPLCSNSYRRGEAISLQALFAVVRNYNQMLTAGFLSSYLLAIFAATVRHSELWSGVLLVSC